MTPLGVTLSGMTQRLPASLVAVAVAVLGLASPAHSDPAPAATVPPCVDELDGTMTLLPDQRTYAACGQTAAGWLWSDLSAPFEPNDSWLSYGPTITLHGQGMRNPNLTAGQWSATPRDPQTTCRAQQTTVVAAGELAPPVITAGEQGTPLSLQLLPKLFYLELSGNCLWRKV